MLPQEMGCGSGTTCWRRLRDWQCAGVWKRPHQAVLQRLHEAEQIDWERASLDSASVPAPGGEANGKDPTNHGKLGTKQHLVVDRTGLPLAVTISGANVHDSKLLEDTVDAIPPLRRPHRQRGRPRKRPRSCMPTRAMTMRAADRRCAHAASSPASPAAASNRARSRGGIAGWWKAPSHTTYKTRLTSKSVAP